MTPGIDFPIPKFGKVVFAKKKASNDERDLDVEPDDEYAPLTGRISFGSTDEGEQL